MTGTESLIAVIVIIFLGMFLALLPGLIVLLCDEVMERPRR